MIMVRNKKTGKLLKLGMFHDLEYQFDGLVVAKTEHHYDDLSEFLDNHEDYELVRVKMKVVEVVGPVVSG